MPPDETDRSGHAAEAEAAFPLRSCLTCFYSFKGGIGRTMAAVAVAQRLAARRRRVLLVDADLEAPGITLSFLSEEERRTGEGFAEIVEYAAAALLDAAERGQPLLTGFAETIGSRILQAARQMPVPPPERSDLQARLRSLLPNYPPFRKTGDLFLLPAGRMDAQYVARIGLQETFDYSLEDMKGLAPLVRSAGVPEGQWPGSLGVLLVSVMRRAFRSLMSDTGPDTHEGQAKTFDYVFLDARTGLADVAGFCVRGLADRLVLFSGLNRQNVVGFRRVLDQIPPEMRTPERLVTVISPVPFGELQLLDKRLQKWKEAVGEGLDPLMLHYEPWLALDESAFQGPVFERAVLAKEYDHLCDAVARLSRDDQESWLGPLSWPVRPEGQRDEAEHLHRRLVRCLVECALLDPSMALTVATIVAGQTRAELGGDARTIDFLRLHAAVAPEDPSSWAALANGLGNVARREAGEGRIEAARRLFEQAFEKYAEALRVKSDLPDALSNWGADLGQLARLEAGEGRAEAARLRFEESFEKFADALRIKPDMHGTLNKWAIGLRALAYLEAGEGRPDAARQRFGEASEKWAGALRIRPDMLNALNSWGTTISDLARLEARQEHPEATDQRMKAALEKCAEARRLSPEEPIYSRSGALILEALARHADSMGDPERANGLREEARPLWEHTEKLAKHVALYGRALDAQRSAQVPEALDFLERAARENRKALHDAVFDPEFWPLRRSGAFRDLWNRLREEGATQPDSASSPASP